jgi:hypothetical protein
VLVHCASLTKSFEFGLFHIPIVKVGEVTSIRGDGNGDVDDVISSAIQKVHSKVDRTANKGKA